jgi:hypothetical protein
VVKTPVNPVFAALFVVCKTNHGIATLVSILPVRETIPASVSAVIGVCFADVALVGVALEIAIPHCSFVILPDEEHIAGY